MTVIPSQWLELTAPFGLGSMLCHSAASAGIQKCKARNRERFAFNVPVRPCRSCRQRQRQQVSAYPDCSSGNCMLTESHQTHISPCVGSRDKCFSTATSHCFLPLPALGQVARNRQWAGVMSTPPSCMEGTAVVLSLPICQHRCRGGGFLSRIPPREL